MICDAQRGHWQEDLPVAQKRIRFRWARGWSLRILSVLAHAQEAEPSALGLAPVGVRSGPADAGNSLFGDWIDSGTRTAFRTIKGPR